MESMTLTAKQCGESLAIWVSVNGIDGNRTAELAQACGVPLRGWFGAAKRRRRLEQEVVILHGAMVLAAMATWFRARALPAISEAYTAYISPKVLRSLQAGDATFATRYTNRLRRYVTPPEKPVPEAVSVRWAENFVRNLEMDPTLKAPAVQKCSIRIREWALHLRGFVADMDVKPVDALDALDRETVDWPDDRAALADAAHKAILEDDDKEADRLGQLLRHEEWDAVETALAFLRAQDTAVKA